VVVDTAVTVDVVDVAADWAATVVAVAPAEPRIAAVVWVVVPPATGAVTTEATVDWVEAAGCVVPGLLITICSDGGAVVVAAGTVVVVAGAVVVVDVVDVVVVVGGVVE
jgi:hypothetical protein